MARPAPDFGSCWSCITDLVMPSTMASGFQVVAEAILRRWQTPRGGLIDDPNYGFDLSDYIGDDLDTRGLARIGQAAAAEAQKDERVLNAAVTVSLIGDALTVAGLISTAKGPFRLVVSVDQVNTTLLQVSAL